MTRWQTFSWRTSFLTSRTSPTFDDPTDKGLKKLCNTEWVHETLAQDVTDMDMEEEHDIDLDYD